MKKTRKLKISLISILLTFGIGVSFWILFNSSFFNPTKLIIPNDGFDHLVSKEIKSVIKPAGLIPLREKNLPKDDIEIRFWYFPSFNQNEGVILKKTDKIWKAFYLKGKSKGDEDIKNNKLQNVIFRQIIGKHVSGWDVFIKDFFGAEILTIKDASEDTCEYGQLDGAIFVVEVYKNKTYRIYKQYDTDESKCNEIRKMQRVTKIIEKEFQDYTIKNCRTGGWLSC